MEFKAGQLVTHHSKWTFDAKQKNKYIVLKVITIPPFDKTSLKLFCFNGWHYGSTIYLDAQGMELWK
tara:strand:- start:310 stop:510 length:201 start_codon:yes stop_codon:yes gene_type:complete